LGGGGQTAEVTAQEIQKSLRGKSTKKFLSKSKTKDQYDLEKKEMLGTGCDRREKRAGERSLVNGNLPRHPRLHWAEKMVGGWSQKKLSHQKKKKKEACKGKRRGSFRGAVCPRPRVGSAKINTEYGEGKTPGEELKDCANTKGEKNFPKEIAESLNLVCCASWAGEKGETRHVSDGSRSEKGGGNYGSHKKKEGVSGRFLLPHDWGLLRHHAGLQGKKKNPPTPKVDDPSGGKLEAGGK